MFGALRRVRTRLTGRLTATGPSSGDMTLEAALRDLLSDRAASRAAAADALARMPSASPRWSSEQRQQAVHALLRATRDDDGPVRFSALCTLMELRADEVVPRLYELLDDEVPLVRQAAVAAFGELEVAEGFDTLAAILDHGPAESRFQAAVSLAQIDTAAAVPLLIAALRDPDVEVKANVAAALGDAARSGAVSELQATQAAEGLAAFLEPKTRGDLRFEAALALSGLKDRRATPVLCEYLDKLSHGLAAAEALGTLGDEAALPALRRIQNRIWSPRLLRVACAGALMMMGQDDGEAFLVSRVRRGPPDVRGLAIGALGYGTGAAGRQALERIALDARDSHAASAVAALRQRGDPASRPVLEKVAGDHPDDEARELAAEALNKPATEGSAA